MKILFIANVNSPLLNELVKRIRQSNPDVVIDIMSYKTRHAENTNFNTVIDFDLFGEKFKRIPIIYTLYNIYLFKKQFKQLNRSYDVCHIQYVQYIYRFILKNITSVSKKLIVTYWGSDFYRTSHIKLKLQKKIVDSADGVTTANQELGEALIKFFKIKSNEVRVCRFGLSPLEIIQINSDVSKAVLKQSLNIPQNSFTIMCGYNADRGQQHERIIDSILEIEAKLPENYCLLFPMTYGGGSDYKGKVQEKLDAHHLNYRMFTSFMSNEAVAALRLVTNVMIQVQVTDQLSGSMQEHLFAHNYVITGDWLPYDLFDINQVFYRKIPQVDQVGKEIIHYIQHKENIEKELLKNSEKIWELSSWESNIGSWMDLYKCLPLFLSH